MQRLFRYRRRHWQQPHSLFAASFLCGRISFHWHQYKCRKNQAVEDPLPWVEFKFFFKGVLVTQRLSWILSGANKVYNWASHLEHLQSIEFDADRAPESPISFDSFEKNVSLRSRPRWNTREGARQLGRTSRRKRSIASKLPSSEIWVSVAYKVIVPLILPWPCFRPQQLEILETNTPPPPKRLSLSPHTPRTHILCVQRMAGPPTRKLGRRRRDNIA